jgi:hypothetical protein
MIDTERPAFLWNVHSYVNEYIRFADTKAELVVAWTSAIMGVLVAAKLHHHVGWSFTGLLTFAGLTSLVIAFGLAFWAVVPRLWTTQPQGFVFWKSIVAHGTKEKFVEAFMAEPADRLANHIAGHLFELSRVCDAKYWWVNYSIVFAFVGSVLSGAMYLALN